MTTKRCEIVFTALELFHYGTWSEAGQFWQDVAFRLYDDMTTDNEPPSATTLARALDNVVSFHSS